MNFEDTLNGPRLSFEDDKYFFENMLFACSPISKVNEGIKGIAQR
jgi:hypothetical protein